MDFLSKLDPNVVLVLVGAATSLAGWIYHKAKGDKTDEHADTFQGVMRNVLHDLLPVLRFDTTQAELRVLVGTLAWKGLAKAGIPKNGLSEAIVNAGIEHTVADALDFIREYADELETAAKEAAPKLKLLSMDADRGIAEGRKVIEGPGVTIIPRDGTEKYSPAFPTLADPQPTNPVPLS